MATRLNGIPIHRQYERELATEAWDAVADADYALVMLDAAKPVGGPELFLLSKVKAVQEGNPNLRLILVLNKVRAREMGSANSLLRLLESWVRCSCSRLTHLRLFDPSSSAQHTQVDLVEPKERLLVLVERVSALVKLTDVFMVSSSSGDGVGDLEVSRTHAHAHAHTHSLGRAGRGQGVDAPWLAPTRMNLVPHLLASSYHLTFLSPFSTLLQNYLFMNAHPREWEYDQEERTDASELEQASEIVREAIYNRMHKEIPYAVGQETVQWMLLRNGSLRLDQRLLVERETHKGLLVAAVKQITAAAQLNLEAAFKRKVHLYLRIHTKSQVPI